MKTIFKIAAIFSLVLLFACSGYGEKVSYDGTEIYYTEGVSKEVADKTGAYLEEMGFTDGTPKSVQLAKEENYHFKMVVQQQYAQDTTKDINFKALGFLLSQEVFDGEPLKFHICDNTFETIRTFPIEGSKQ